jgi:glycosyltransferase involved in cell wall biosynthesis
MNRLIFVNRYFFPDHSATSQILSDLAFQLAKRGKEVHVITSRQLYDDHKARLTAEEIVRGVHVHRIPTTRFGRSTLLGRGLDYLSFYASMWRSTRALARRNDILIAKTDPPLISVLAMLVARHRGARLVNWLQDIYPEVAMQLGVPFFKGRIGAFLCSLRNKSLHAAVANVVVGNLMGRKIASFGISAKRIHVIPNWCDDHNIFPIATADNPLRREWGLQEKFVVGYSGNLGRAHEYQTILAASERLKKYPHIIFLLVGGGHLFDELARSVKTRDLDQTYRFMPYQNQTNLNYALGVADVHWISLRPEVDGLIVPSKFYGIAAAGKPIIAITTKDGEIAQLVRDYNCGVVVEPGDAETLATAIVQLSLNAELLKAMGGRARTMLEAQFTREQAFERWRCIIDDVSRRGDFVGREIKA